MKKEKIYLPDSAIRNGLFHVVCEIFFELKQNRWLIFQLFKRDLLSLYKQSLLGFMWAFIFPIVSVGTFLVLNRSGIFNIDDTGIPYPVFAITGMAFWQLFSTGINATSSSLVKAGNMIVKINFSKKSLVLASIGQSILSFSVQLLLIVSLFAYYGIVPGWQVLLIPVLILPIIFLTLGVGFLLSILNGIFRDTGNIISILMTFFMFLTPVLYPKPLSGFLSRISDFNPLYYLVSFSRDIILFGKSDLFTGFMLSTLLSLIVFCVCIFIFHLTESRVAERI